MAVATPFVIIEAAVARSSTALAAVSKTAGAEILVATRTALHALGTIDAFTPLTRRMALAANG